MTGNVKSISYSSESIIIFFSPIFCLNFFIFLFIEREKFEIEFRMTLVGALQTKKHSLHPSIFVCFSFRFIPSKENRKLNGRVALWIVLTLFVFCLNILEMLSLIIVSHMQSFIFRSLCDSTERNAQELKNFSFFFCIFFCLFVTQILHIYLCFSLCCARDSMRGKEQTIEYFPILMSFSFELFPFN